MRMHCLLAHRRPLSRPSRRPDPRHLLLLLLLFSATSLGLLAYYVSRSSRRVSLFVAPTPNRGTQTTHLPFRPLQSCSEPWVKGIKHRRSTENLEPSLMKSNISGSLFAKHSWLGTQRNVPVVLLFLETHYSSLGQEIIALLEGARFGYQLEVAAAGFKGDLPSLRAPDGQARFAAVVFENVLRYVRLDGHKKKLLEKYCSQFGMGIIGFLQINEHGSPGPDLPGLGLRVQTFSELKHATINPTATALRLTRPGNTFPGLLPGREWSAFHWNASTFQSLLLAYPIACQPSQGQAETVVVYDRGLQDGVQRVIFGNGLFFWLQRLLFVDILAAVSRGRLSLKPDRYLLVDIDDIFVGKDGTRMSPADVEALLTAQNHLRDLVPNFTFNLGFSGKFYHTGSALEDAGDDLLLAYRHHFWWFPHMWNHMQPHLFPNETFLVEQMRLNKQFAIDHGIPTDTGYAVSPHHSGTYPVHPPLYQAWRRVWDIRVTSTEEYPHLRPARHRRGFIHKGIMVLPRQTCGLFTHTIFYKQYPGGPEELDRSIQGGELFFTLLFNPVSIFMTHLSNYGNDRLGLYTFEGLLKFVRCWTRLRVQTLPPLAVAEKYFQLFPAERKPLWQNPCDDKRHWEIWSKENSCDRLPQLIIIGPQKTGTTALHAFLSLHPALTPSLPSESSFEEVQFFNGNNYYKGIDWYMDFFPVSSNTSSKLRFEKTANYFEAEAAPERAAALLPRARLIAVITSPTDRAYSWYQHQRAHGDPTALNHTFLEVVSAGPEGSSALQALQHRCLNPGLFSTHVQRWLQYYPATQLLLLDGQQLRSKPATLLDSVQRFLNISPYFNYTQALTYEAHKGFWCIKVKEGKPRCLGKGKGRKYPEMEAQARVALLEYYHTQNLALVKMLNRLGLPLPLWLREELFTSQPR